MSRYHWKESDREYLIANYATMNPQFIADHIGVSVGSVYTMANKLKVNKPEGSQRHAKLEILLDNSLQSLYWIGFLLADGHFHKRGNTVRLDQSVKDLDHLKLFKEYIKHTKTIGYTSEQKKHVISTTCHITATNCTTIPELVKRFDIRSNKTYYPPDFTKYELNNDQWLALIIGFIDGDGYIKLAPSGKNSDYNRIKINIEIHSSWLDNLKFVKTILYTRAGKMHRYVDPKINKDKLAHTSIACTEVVNMLNAFINENNLYVLRRKWDKFITVNSFNRHNNVHSVKRSALNQSCERNR